MPGMNPNERMQQLFFSSSASAKEGRLGPALFALDAMLEGASPYNQYVLFYQHGEILSSYNCFALAALCYRKAKELALSASVADGGADATKKEAFCLGMANLLNAGGAFRPEILVMEVSSCCNYACPKCLHPTMKREKRHLNPQDFRSFIERWRDHQGDFLEILFTGGGEVLLNPQFEEIARIAKEIMPRALLTTASNGALLTKVKAMELYKAGIKRWEISLDTLDSEAYYSFTGDKGSLDVVVSNIKALWGILKEDPESYVEIAAHFYYISEERLKKSVEEMNRKIGGYCHLFRGAPLHSLMGRKEDCYSSFDKDVKIKRKRQFVCMEPWRIMSVACDGSVRRCCSDMFDCPDNELLGNVFKESLDNVIFNSKRIELQYKFAKGEYDGVYLCQNCFIPYFEIEKGYR